LYDGNRNSLREYIQNSFDAGAKRVDVYFENKHIDLIIKDDGCGMDEKELEKSLYLGVSEKSGELIGWRGIGIWSGIPVCRRIVIITKKQGHPKFRVEINADMLRDQYTLNKPAIEVLNNITGNIENIELGKDETLEESHFTTVRLEEMLPNQHTIFTDNLITDYLSQNLPAPFDTDKFTLGKEINKRLSENGIKTEMAEIFFENQKIFRPPYNNDLFFETIIDKKLVINGKPVAYCWLITGKNNSVLKPPNRGIYFKKKGITIGDENLVIKQHDGMFNQWQYGEIHIITDDLKENAPRNNFEANNDILEPLNEQVGVFIGSVQEQNRYQSHNINTKTIEHIKQDVNSGELKYANNTIVKLKKKLKQKRSFPKDPALLKMKEAIDLKSAEENKSIEELEKEILEKTKEGPSDLIKEKMERLSELTKACHPELKEHLRLTTKRGKLELNIDAMDPVANLLRQKTGLSISEIAELSQRSFDWKNVERGDNGPILTLANKKPNNEDRYRDRLFGAMISALHYLFVDPYKHERGKISFSYYETMSDEEKIDTMTEFLMTQDLILRLIEKSKNVKDL
jgi:hypothetical protein